MTSPLSFLIPLLYCRSYSHFLLETVLNIVSTWNSLCQYCTLHNSRFGRKIHQAYSCNLMQCHNEKTEKLCSTCNNHYIFITPYLHISVTGKWKINSSVFLYLYGSGQSCSPSVGLCVRYMHLMKILCLQRKLGDAGYGRSKGGDVSRSVLLIIKVKLHPKAFCL